MKPNIVHKLKLSLGILLLLVLGLPGGLLARDTIVSVPSPQQSTTVEIEVVIAPQAKANIGLDLSLPSECGLAEGGLNSIQDAGLINFNQPAGCFVLRTNRPAVHLSLAVATARPQATVKVAQQAPVVGYSYGTPALPSIPMPALPIMPLATAGLIAMIMVVAWQRSAAQTVRKSYTLTLVQLQMFRC